MSNVEGAVGISNIAVQGGATPHPSGDSQYGLRVDSGSNTIELSNLGFSGEYNQAPIVISGGHPSMSGLSFNQLKPIFDSRRPESKAFGR